MKFQMALERLFDAFMIGVDPYLFWALGALLALLGLAGLGPLQHNATMGSHETAHVYYRHLLLRAIGLCLLILVMFVTIVYSAIGGDQADDILSDLALRWGPFVVSALILGILSRLFIQRYLRPQASALLKRLRVEQKVDELSDIRTEVGRYKAQEFTASEYYQPDSVFLGLTPASEPVHVLWKVWHEVHKALVGATRFGKGITTQALAEQIINRGDGLWVVLPKYDKYMGPLIKQLCQDYNRTLVELNLFDEKSSGKYSPFEGGTRSTRRARFNNIMEVDDRGQESDFYKALTREQMIDLWADGQDVRIKTLYNLLVKLSAGNNDESKALIGPRSRLKEWAAYAKFDTPKLGRGFSVEKSLLNNAVVIVYGDLDDAVVLAATRCLIQEFMQETRRLAPQRSKHVTLIIDELRFLVSRIVVDALAVVAGYDVDVVVQFQSFGDLTNPLDTRLDGESIKKSILTNCQAKFMFGGTEFDTAEYVASLSGQTIKNIVQRETTDINTSGGEEWTNQRMMGNKEEALVSENTTLALPPRVGTLLMPGELARIVSVWPVTVRDEFMPVPIAPATQQQASTAPATP